MEKNVKKKGRLKMALFTFSGGVHPADGKEFAKNSPITEYLPKGDVVLPLGQHIGAPAQPIVSKGDQVLVGQKVAEAGSFGANFTCVGNPAPPSPTIPASLIAAKTSSLDIWS